MKGAEVLQRPLLALPVSARPVTRDEIKALERRRFWASVEAKQAEKRALLAVAQDTAQALREGEAR